MMVWAIIVKQQRFECSMRFAGRGGPTPPIFSREIGITAKKDREAWVPFPIFIRTLER
jgi:hypothetical protein